MSNDTPVWFVTGCSTGFGREIVKQLLALVLAACIPQPRE